MTYVIYFNATIGFLLEAVLLFYLLKEVWRAWRQAVRVATINARHRLFRRRASCGEVLYTFRKEFMRSYAAIQIGGIIIPHNPRHRITRYRPY